MHQSEESGYLSRTCLLSLHLPRAAAPRWAPASAPPGWGQRVRVRVSGQGQGQGQGQWSGAVVRGSGQGQGQDELALALALASSGVTSGQAGTTPRVKSKERRVRKPLNGWHVRAYASRTISLKLVAALAALVALAALPPERRAGEWQLTRRLPGCALALPPERPGLGQPSTLGGVWQMAPPPALSRVRVGLGLGWGSVSGLE